MHKRHRQTDTGIVA